MNSIVGAVFAHAETQPEKFCIADSRNAFTCREFRDRIAAYASYLKSLGVGAGDRVIIRNSQNTAFMTAVLAVQLLGAISVPLEKNIADERVREICEEIRARLYIANKAAEGLSVPWEPVSRILSSEADPEETAALAGPARNTDPDSIAEILFTTGTTGKSKGIVLLHRSVTAVAENVIDGVEMKKDNVELIPVPLSHSHGLRRTYANLLNGSGVVIMDGIVFINPIFRAMETYHVTAMDLVPAALAALLKLGGEKLGQFAEQMDYIQLGSAPIPETDQKTLCRLFPRTRLYNFYGTTESGCSCILDFNDGTERRNCIGRPTVHTTFAFFGDDGEPVAATPEQPGLLATSGAMNMEGYFTWELFDALRAKKAVEGKDEFIVTQDLGWRGEDGLIYLLGRQGDVISSGGSKIAPQEIEEIANLMPGVVECACVPMPDPILGQAPLLFYVTEQEGAPEEQEIYDYLQAHLEKYKVPKEMRRIDKIPRTYNGKISRKDLKP